MPQPTPPAPTLNLQQHDSNEDLDSIITTLGFANLVPEVPFAKLSPSVHLQNPSSEDNAKAREILVRLRTCDPSYKAPTEQKRRFLRSGEKNKALADPESWQFSEYEIARGIVWYFGQDIWPSTPLLNALVSMIPRSGSGSIDDLWNRTYGSPAPKKSILSSKDKAEAKPCPWLAFAVERQSFLRVAVLCQGGMSKSVLDSALEMALDGQLYDVAAELLAYNASFPSRRPDLFAAAITSTEQSPDTTFIRLWLSAPSPPPRELAIQAMMMAVRSKLESSTMAFRVFLANVAIYANEAEGILLQAVSAVNLEAIALLSVGIRHNWAFLRNGGELPVTRRAVQIKNHRSRYRVLSFLLSAGIDPDVPALRNQLLKDVKEGRTDHVQLLIRSGVSPHKTDNNDTSSPISSLHWAVKNVKLDALVLLIEANIPSDVASMALSQIPLTAPEPDKIGVYRLLDSLGAAGEPVSRLLLGAVCASENILTEVLLLHDATSNYVDDRGRNTLHIALQRGDLDLFRKLCAAGPSPPVASGAVPLAMDVFSQGRMTFHDLLDVLTLLVAEGATGTPVEQVILDSISAPDYDKLLQILLPGGISSATIGAAIAGVLELDTSEPLQRLCETNLADEHSIEMGLTTVLWGATQQDPVRDRALILAQTAQRCGYWNCLNQLLVKSIAHDTSDLVTAAMLLQCGATADCQSGLALRRAIRAEAIDMVELLCDTRIGSETATEAFCEVKDANLSDELRLRMYRLLLQHDVGQNLRDKALLKACTKPIHESAAVLLAQHSASLDFEGGKTLLSAVESEDLSLLRALLKTAKLPTSGTISKAFDKAFSLPKDARLVILEMLMPLGVDENTLSSHLLHAIQDQDLVLLKLLLATGTIDWSRGGADCLSHAVAIEYVAGVKALTSQPGGVPSSVVVAAFKGLIDTRQPTAAADIEIITTLLELWSITVETMGEALLRTLQNVSSSHSLLVPRDFVELMLERGADATVDMGECFRIAAERADLDLVNQLTSYPFDLDIAVMALIETMADEDTLIEWFDICISQGTQLGGDGSGRLHSTALLVLAFMKFPASQRLVARLLEHGCCTCQDCLEPHSEVSWEEKPALLSLAIDTYGVSDNVVLELVSKGDQAQLELTSPTTGHSAVHLAIQHVRVGVLRHLVDHGANINLEDLEGLSPLCHATKSENLEAMVILLDAGARTNDGSLHIAARNLSVPCINLLKQYGHDIQQPSELLDGRPPLAELCYAAKGSGPKWEHAVEAAMKALCPLLSHEWRASNGKSVLHYAIDNPTSAVPVLRVFLRVSGLWRNPGRDDDWLYTDAESELCFSPTKYIKHLCISTKHPEERADLIDLLKANQFRDRYYSLAAGTPQPVGYIGLPQSLADSIREEKEAEWKTQQELQRLADMHEHQARLTAQGNERALRHQEMQQRMDLEAAKKRAALERKEMRDKKRVQENHEREMIQIQLQKAAAQHQVEGAMADQRFAHQQRMNMQGVYTSQRMQAIQAQAMQAQGMQAIGFQDMQRTGYVPITMGERSWQRRMARREMYNNMKARRFAAAREMMMNRYGGGGMLQGQGPPPGMMPQGPPQAQAMIGWHGDGDRDYSDDDHDDYSDDDHDDYSDEDDGYNRCNDGFDEEVD